jgi:pimeloyl-[acyl-carrier protein] methyl ester esterase
MSRTTLVLLPGLDGTGDLAATAPPGLCGLILCSTFVFNPQPYLRPLRQLLSILPVHSAPSWVSRFLILGKFATPELLKLYQQTLARLPPTTVRKRLRAILECDVTVALANVRVPVLCLTAKHDRLILNAAAHLIHHHAPAATIVEIDAPHFLLQCRPSDAADALRMFLRQFDPSHGDYTADRDRIVGNPTVDDLIGELEQWRQSPSGK